ncbi:YebC/PmpR family DNA-binding transcriptional regulator [Listeria sp. ILCC797]|uniref:YebC/PmpR family DNA-binding transcriptional regulator n=1 Tax=Listeria sp. ILCC797 TaxID=1918333 RepID=UPI000B58C193|nr:YebC/PmpR family DNA-binding transcriptional regulator [Listeria sp. ILCC797]
MAGHSKWKNIQGRKNAQDSKRAKVFQKLAKEIYVAAKSGADPALNPALRLVMDKAKAANMPNDNMERAIQKAAGNQAGENYDEISYEGYGPGGVAVLVHALTDNKNRTGTNVRVAFNKNGGSLGETGSVAYMFNRKGYLVVLRENLDLSEDEFILLAIEAGAEDIITSDEAFEVFTAPADFTVVKDELEQAGLKFEAAELTMQPTLYQEVPENKRAEFDKMISILEDDDDVQEVYTNSNND